MKKVGILGSMLGAGLLQLLAQGGGWKDVGRTSVPRRYTYSGRTPTITFRSSAERTTAARHWHNPADPVQAARIEAAAAKRERKAERLALAVGHAWSRNYAHHKAFYALEQGHIAPLNLNPFYIAK